MLFSESFSLQRETLSVHAWSVRIWIPAFVARQTLVVRRRSVHRYHLFHVEHFPPVDSALALPAFFLAKLRARRTFKSFVIASCALRPARHGDYFAHPLVLISDGGISAA